MSHCGGGPLHRVGQSKAHLGLALLIVGVALGVGAPSALAVVSAEYSGVSFGPDGTPGTSFVDVQGVAVDQGSEDVYVYDIGEGGKIYKFDAAGNPINFSSLGTNVIEGVGGPVEAGTEQIAVAPPGALAQTAGDIYVANNKEVVVYDENGERISELTGGEICGVATDPTGHVFVGIYGPGPTRTSTVREYTPHEFVGHPLNDSDQTGTSAHLNQSLETSLFEICNVAVDGLGVGNVYATTYNGGLQKLQGLHAPAAATIDNSSSSLAVKFSNNVVYANQGSRVVEYSPATNEQIAAFGETGPGALAGSHGIALNDSVGQPASGNVYVSSGAGQVEIFSPVPFTPDATTEAATGTTNGNATLHGAINAGGGPPASCVFEYVEAQAEGFAGASTVPCAPAGPFTGTASQAVQAQLGGLAEANYRFRLVTTNANGSNAGQALDFSTEEGNVGLPDGRDYEMVSPAAKAGEVFPPDPAGRLGNSCFDCVPGELVAKMPMQVSPDGRSVVYEGQPFGAGLASGPNEYLAKRSATGWVTEGLSRPTYRTDPVNAFQVGGFVAFAADLDRGLIVQDEPPLAPAAPAGYDNLYPWQGDAALVPVITAVPPPRTAADFEIVFGGANAGTATAPAFDHLVFAANDALTGPTAFAPAAPEVGVEEDNVYEWAAAQLRLVNVRPDGSALPGAVVGSGRQLLQDPLSEGPDFDHAVSADGSRVFWSDNATGQVYLRIDGRETLEIPDPTGKFLTASADGSRVLLSDGHLFAGLGVEEPPEETDLTAGQGEFQGILGAADDLSTVYFVDTAVLPGAGANQRGEEAQGGEYNLYAWHEGATAFVATLLRTDNEFGGGSKVGVWHPAPAFRNAQVSPDGRYLAFMSTARLTGYGNDQHEGAFCASAAPASNPACAEVFEYDRGAAKLSCASCNPAGERPLGPSNLSLIENELLATFLPQPGNLTAQGQGRLFFESQDALAPRDTNGHIQDVYEWEPNGVGSCAHPQGCVSLISSGHSPRDSYFLNATPSGDDAFFVTRERLLPQDGDDYLDLYDARVGGGFPAGTTAPCSGEACKGSVSSLPQPGLGSAQFNGPGNPPRRACKAGFVKKQGKCVKKKHRKHKKHQKRSASPSRRGSK